MKRNWGWHLLWDTGVYGPERRLQVGCDTARFGADCGVVVNWSLHMFWVVRSDHNQKSYKFHIDLCRHLPPSTTFGFRVYLL